MSAKEQSEDISSQPTTELKLEPPKVSSLIAGDIGAATHQGHKRKNNEDHYLVIKFNRSLENLTTNIDDDVLRHSYSLTGYGMLVADGMGGMAGGEVASRMALKRLVELIVDTPDWMMSLNDQAVSTVMERMNERFLQVDQTLRAAAQRDMTLRGMGTTLTVAGQLGDDLIIGHIGDSRAYLFRENKLTQITSDHTLAQALIDAGVAKPDDPETKSMRHVLTTALGALSDKIPPQIHRLRISNGDQVLLCSDGLTEMVEDANIASVVSSAPSAQQACDQLITLALAAGGLDNVTVIVARFAPGEN